MKIILYMYVELPHFRYQPHAILINTPSNYPIGENAYTIKEITHTGINI